jgi:hypothetical protein
MRVMRELRYAFKTLQEKLKERSYWDEGGVNGRIKLHIKLDVTEQISVAQDKKQFVCS